jgi:hypothetical protein
VHPPAYSGRAGQVRLDWCTKSLSIQLCVLAKVGHIRLCYIMLDKLGLVGALPAEFSFFNFWIFSNVLCL